MTTSLKCANTIGNKENKAFMILSALGILFVVDDHLGRSISFFTQIFPYDSFFMPMFAFISGYFFKEKHVRSWKSILSFSIKKFKKLMLPYLGWIVFYGAVQALLHYAGILEMGMTTPKDLIYNILTSGTSFGFNSSSWFVPTLFCVTVTYCLIRKLFKKHWNDTAAMIICAIAAAAAVYISRTDFYTPKCLMLLKVPFFLQFYHLGVLFHSRLEAWFDKISTILLCTCAVIINIVLLSIYGEDIAFPICSTMSGFYTNNPFLPLVTSVTGIAFWLKIAKSLTPVLGQNSLVNFISDNTFFIMTHHVGIKHLFTGFLIWGYQWGLDIFRNVDVQAFRTDPWYVYGEYAWCKVACFIFTMIVVLLNCKVFQVLKNNLLSTAKQP